ncbi:hypothetical protein BUALT_Bualt08G0066000 [Buddleja alternifolia]|uniref:Transposase n=1 Tax=Buddleja alternifolia TaxID=168488 RepID=A0AAV6XF44_9LAMI|nr:hypothetical protein BUALT_Bualt08G0066000 [Buddleja alternifolia]
MWVKPTAMENGGGRKLLVKFWLWSRSSSDSWCFSDTEAGGVNDSDNEIEGGNEVGGEGANKAGGERDSAAVASEDDFDSELDFDEEKGPNFYVFNHSTIFNPSFVIGMLFSNRKEFRMSVNSHAIVTKRNLKTTKNDNRRIYARCMGDGCDWRINALRLGGENGESTFQIRQYNPKHKCARSYEIKNCTFGWMSRKYTIKFILDPKRNVKGFINDVIEEIGFSISQFQAYRAKSLALKAIEGNAEEQYTKLWNYAQEMRRLNPGSTVIMQMTEVDGQGMGRKFDKFYVGLNGLRKGFMSGCRPILGVDGCHLKGPHGGILLTCVFVDPNNCLYPIAYAVVTGETKNSWEWFLRLLKEDLNIEMDDTITFVNDKQKGLLLAFDNVFLGSDNRFCVRHLHGNLKRAGFRGLAYKVTLWNATKATTVPEFDIRMQKLGEIDLKDLEWFNDKPPSQWSRSHFKTFPKCDMLLNNVCETFNFNILDAREKLVLTMLEWIRKIVDKNMDNTIDCIPIKSDDLHYEIGCYSNNGQSAICCQKLDPEDFVHISYTVETYLKVYDHSILPVNGPRLWAKTGFIPPMPPNFGSFCGGKGHNQKGCDVRKRVERDEDIAVVLAEIFERAANAIGMRESGTSSLSRQERGTTGTSSQSHKLTARKRKMGSQKEKGKVAAEVSNSTLRTTQKQKKNKRGKTGVPSAEVSQPRGPNPAPSDVRMSAPIMTPPPTPRVNIRALSPSSYMPGVVLSQASQTSTVASAIQSTKEKSKKAGKKPPWKI